MDEQLAKKQARHSEAASLATVREGGPANAFGAFCRDMSKKLSNRRRIRRSSRSTPTRVSRARYHAPPA